MSLRERLNYSGTRANGAEISIHTDEAIDQIRNGGYWSNLLTVGGVGGTLLGLAAYTALHLPEIEQGYQTLTKLLQ